MAAVAPLASPWLTKGEAAVRARCTVRTIERGMRDGTLPFTGGGRVGGHRVLIHVHALDVWVAKRKGGKSS